MTTTVPQTRIGEALLSSLPHHRPQDLVLSRLTQLVGALVLILYLLTPLQPEGVGATDDNCNDNTKSLTRRSTTPVSTIASNTASTKRRENDDDNSDSTTSLLGDALLPSPTQPRLRGMEATTTKKMATQAPLGELLLSSQPQRHPQGQVP
ncbi:hypothetical protein ABVK25_006107 [Lepraria finkii]|uniref:Uncharacterized protein n=1 Tax=Lepraria finkii TaxID=1340010 RepID=A0ABR4B6G7_9LECA